MTEKQHYELMFMIPAKYAGEELLGIKDKVKALLEKSNAEITKETEMGRRRLAYPIKHVYQAFYYVMELDIEADKLEKIYTTLKLMPEILRYIMVKKRVLSEKELEAEAKLNASVRQELIEKGVIKENSTNEKMQGNQEYKKTEQQDEKVDVQVEDKVSKEVKENKPIEDEKLKEDGVEEAGGVENDNEPESNKVKLEDLDKNLDDIISDDINDRL